MRISKLTERILMSNRMARNSDKVLFLEILDRLGADLTYKQKQILSSFNFESVRRTRQKLQSDGKYLPDQKIALERRMKSYEAQQNMPGTKPENVSRFTEMGHAIPWMEN